MNETRAASRRLSPLGQLVLARLREFYREWEAIFWVYGFPILMMAALGVAFQNKPIERIAVDIETSPASAKIAEGLAKNEKHHFETRVSDADTARTRLRTGKTDLVVIPKTSTMEITAGFPSTRLQSIEYLFDPTRPESVIARDKTDDALQAFAGRKPTIQVSDIPFEEPGGRYIDFLVPGLLGMGLMGGGLWGVGFVTVDMRIRKLLKRFLATPMRKSQFLAAIMISRMLFMIPEVLILLVFARYVFGVMIRGNLLAVGALIFLGAVTFAGLGLLIASRARTLEAVSGLMNLVMLPMWVLSGIFFSSERFPAAVQPFIKAVPLTPLINALRAVILEGATLQIVWRELAILAGWGVVSFLLALKLFRWK